VIDPEYLSNMEHPRTTVASFAGLRTGYGSGIASSQVEGFPMLGHGGGIEGFVSTYGYSPARDIGYVILLNSSTAAARRALERLSSLAIRYLKRDVGPPARPEAQLEASVLDRYVGYYQDANPRNQFLWPLQRFLTGRSVRRDGDHLYLQTLGGEAARLVPVSETMFRRENDLDATLVFASDSAGRMVLSGAQIYAERRPRWSMELLRVPLLAAVLIGLSPLVVAIVWVARVGQRGFWDLKGTLLACPIALAAAVLPLALTPLRQWGTQNAATILVFLATLALPALALAITALALAARKQCAGKRLVAYALVVALAVAGLSVYLGANGLIGLRLWSF